MADITYRTVRNTREVVYRAVLAPDKAFEEWTVGDFRRFVRDCDAQGIGDSARVERESDPWLNGGGGCFTAERKVDLGPVPYTPDTTELRGDLPPGVPVRHGAGVRVPERARLVFVLPCPLE